MATPIARENGHRIEGTIAALPLFKGMARKDLATLSGAARLERARKGESILQRGKALRGIMAVADGLVKVALRRADGVERVLRFVGPGETFGEAAVLLSRPSAVDAVALADTAYLVLPAGAVRALVARHGGFARRLATLLAERMLSLLTEVEASELRPAGERLAAYLLSLAQPRDGDGTWTVLLPATKTLVASRLGMKKETLSRLLHGLATRHLIEVSRREIAILDRGALAELARI